MLRTLLPALAASLLLAAAACSDKSTPGAPGAPGAAGAGQKFSVVIESPGANVAEEVKEVRTITGLGLAEAQDIVTNKKPVKTALSREEAERILGRLEKAGAKAAIR